MTHILRTSTEHITAPIADEGNCVASLDAHTTLNPYNLWKLALRGHLNTDARTRDRTRNFFYHRNDAVTTRPQLYKTICFHLQVTFSAVKSLV